MRRLWLGKRLLEMNRNMIAALYVEKDGAYAGLEGIDLWDIERDARKYDGPYPVVAHPPCNTWSVMAYVVEKKVGIRVGDDGGCFASALAAVRRCGGVLEHPKGTTAWRTFGLSKPFGGCWEQMLDGSWVTEVAQRNYGHPATKRTWLYYVGKTEPAPMDWRTPDAPLAVCGHDARSEKSPMRRLFGAEAIHTPVKFRDALLSLASLAQDEMKGEGGK